MFSDMFPGMPLFGGNKHQSVFVSETCEEIQNAFHKLKEGGQIGMELQATDWSK